jgi:hypothetical protein
MRWARDALERDGNPLEGALSSRSRRDLARGGVQPPSEAESRSKGAQPSSEAEPHPRGRPALERGEVLPVRHRHPRAKRSSARGCPGHLSGEPRAREFILRVLLGSFMFYFLRRVSEFSWLFRELLWLSRTHFFHQYVIVPLPHICIHPKRTTILDATHIIY